MNAADLAQELDDRQVRRRARARSVRVRIVAAIGPVTVLAGVVWALVQPYRLTILHPAGQGFWWLLAEPPLFVAFVGVIFWRIIAPGLVEDLESPE
jgi:hypothetical protein